MYARGFVWTIAISAALVASVESSTGDSGGSDDVRTSCCTEDGAEGRAYGRYVENGHLVALKPLTTSTPEAMPCWLI